MATSLARDWRNIEHMANSLTQLEAKAAAERSVQEEQSSKLPKRRAIAIAKLWGYLAANKQPANEAVLGHLEVADEFNSAMVTEGNWRGNAEQFRRLDAHYKSSPSIGDKMMSRREQFDEMIESESMRSIARRRELSLANGFGDADRVAQIETELFAYRKGLRAWSEGTREESPPQPGPELADRMLEAARTDRVYGYAIKAAAAGRQSFIFDGKMGQEEAEVCHALKRHGESQFASELIDASQDSLRTEADKLRDALDALAVKSRMANGPLHPLLDPGSIDHFDRLDLTSADERVKVVQAARRETSLTTTQGQFR